MLTCEFELILLCAKLNIDNNRQQKIKEILAKPLHWNRIIYLSNTSHEILLFLYYNLDRLNFQDKIPHDIFAKMKSYYYMNISRNLIFEKEIFLILELAGHHGVDIIPLKGLSLILSLYNNPGLRIIADIDILIKKDELYKIKPVFKKLGYKENIEKQHDCRHMAIFSKMLSPRLPLYIEIHSGLAYARPYEINIPHLWERVYRKNMDNQKMLFLSSEDTFISLILHLRSHTRRLELKFIIDIAELLNKDSDKLDWFYIKTIARNNHFMATVYIFMYLSKELLDAKIPPEILNEFKPHLIKRVLIHATINKRNFFTLKKWQGTFVRFLIFDTTLDFLLYLWRVSILERLIKTNKNSSILNRLRPPAYH